MILAAVAALLLFQLGSHAYRAYRLDHHGVRVDAKILSSDVGCFGAIGSGSTPIGGKTITYRVRFPIPTGEHTTKVTRPCRVIPPDFGYGRGAIWIQYDAGNPDRTRVLGDNTDREAVKILAVVTLIYLVGLAIAILAQRVGGRTRDAPTGRHA
ncbi:hypothetical protein FOE78_20455 [Microlunatus elymi]|uniref:DUF3592 domain-containing protein n=1 Tax=Microlunatus elymi TaxID=2596828 RepID=A0A516Q3F3_9ACTN|nr:hypothetical protein [Microlunatus elymi]QDP97956.1 hypothetical protein FOE78_20455 [Microlunatus elymi]